MRPVTTTPSPTANSPTIPIVPYSTRSSMANITPTQPSFSASDHSLWDTPIPYLFCGLAIILCLIAFSLLVLACSYCRNLKKKEESDVERAAENSVKTPKIAVIMAGDDMPRFIATPIGNGIAALFGDHNREKGEKNWKIEHDGKIEKEIDENGLTQENFEENNEDGN